MLTLSPTISRTSPKSTYNLASVLLPVQNQSDHIELVVRSHLEELRKLPTSFELVLIPNGCSDDTEAICLNLAAVHSDVRVVRSPPGWGRSIIEGINQADGDLICFASSARISTADLVNTLTVALDHPDLIVKGMRAQQDNGLRRLGSSLYNWLCRTLFRIKVKDVNGGPKCFPKKFSQLSNLSQHGYLFDVEFNVVCEQNQYEVIDVPIASTPRHGGVSTTTLTTALALYLKLFAYWFETKRSHQRELLNSNWLR